MSRWTLQDVVAAKGRVEAASGIGGYDPVPKTSPSKYGNTKTNGYASKREAKRAEELKLREAAGEIVGLQEQVPFELIPKQDGERSCKYIADFSYKTTHGQLIVEDAKGYRDPVYRIKRKLMLKVHGIRIREV